MCTWVLTHSTGEGGRRSTEGSNRQAVMTVMTHCSLGPTEFHSAKQIDPQVSQTSVSAAGLLHSCEELRLWQCGGLLGRRSVWRKREEEKNILHKIQFKQCFTVKPPVANVKQQGMKSSADRRQLENWKALYLVLHISHVSGRFTLHNNPLNTVRSEYTTPVVNFPVMEHSVGMKICCVSPAVFTCTLMAFVCERGNGLQHDSAFLHTPTNSKKCTI